MKFKRIEVYGFKSFADKHEIPFGSGITGIVGPNGCGKSNVADAIRWVLGEQSAKLLRGAKMQDVIFNGTEKRKSMSYCEVSLVFDNREKMFPTLDFDEVIISRRLTREGTSEYLLNREPTRLKDIVDLLRDGGMGREGYSIIGQGRIDELLSSKPEDRRAIFEEAAGISKFKARKVSAENKLERTRDNLTRIIDILDEKQKQLGPLMRQAETARRWLDYRDLLKHHEINTYIYQFDTAAQAKEIIQTRLNAINEAIVLKQSSYEGAVASYNESMYELNTIDRNISALHDERLRLTVALEKQAGDVKVFKNQISALYDTNNRLKEENVALDKQYTDTLSQIETTSAKSADKTVELEKAKKALDDYRAKYMAAVEQLSKGENAAAMNKQALIDAMDRLGEIRANMSRLLAEREALSASVEQLTVSLAADKEALAAVETEYKLVSAELDATIELNKQLSQALKTAYARNNELLATANDTTNKLDKLNARYHVASSRKNVLTEMRNAFEGFAYSVRNVMNDARKNRELNDKIEGVVAQLITVDKQFETAVETALGNAMQNIVTRDEADAKYIIDYLKRMRYGRITFLPMTSIKARSIEPRHMSALNMNGVFGVASDIVKYNSKYDVIIRGLLGSTVIVDNLDNAVALARRTGYSFKIVTLEGDVINPSGSMTGGSRKSDIGNIFSHDRELKELEVQVAELTANISKYTELKEKCATEIDEIQEKIKDMQSQIHDNDVLIAAKTETKNKLSEEIEELSSSIDTRGKKCDRDASRVAEIDKEINSVSELEAIVNSKKDTATEDDASRQQQFDELKAERDKLQEQMTEARVVCTELESLIKGYASDVERMQAITVEVAGKIEANNEQIAQNSSQILTIESEMGSDEKRDSSEDSKRIVEVNARLEYYAAHKTELQENVTIFDKNRIDLMNELQQFRDAKTKEEMLLLRVDTDIEQYEQRIAEEYNLDYSGCLEFKEENYDAKFGTQEIARLKKAMNFLGHVNVEAIEMSQVVAKEYEELNTQKNDLEKAEEDLVKIIKELSGEMLERFTGQFAKIRTNFIKIFKELFNGGNADLELLDSDNPLDAGIEIKAQPPEKKLQSISLLSGGEKALTAIAILFAILKLKPMPFCLLDEIEAALDDANANRFAKYLRRFSEDTQFIVITHRKPTMELADSLYGVTMQEKGVSKIVSVKLEEAVKNVEKN